MSRSHLIAIALLGLFSAGALHAELPETFLKQYCYKCHGPDKQKAKRRFDTLPATIKDFRQQEQWQEIVDQLNSGGDAAGGRRATHPGRAPRCG